MKHVIKEILYIKKDTFGQEEYLQLKINQNKNILKYSINDKSNIIEINDEKAEIFVEKLFRTTDNWENKYINKNIMDKIIWQLKIIFNDDTQKNYLGENSFPINFEHFIKIKNELLQ